MGACMVISLHIYKGISSSQYRTPCFPLFPIAVLTFAQANICQQICTTTLWLARQIWAIWTFTHTNILKRRLPERAQNSWEIYSENETMAGLLINKWALLPMACRDEEWQSGMRHSLELRRQLLNYTAAPVLIDGISARVKYKFNINWRARIRVTYAPDIAWRSGWRKIYCLGLSVPIIGVCKGAFQCRGSLSSCYIQ